VRYLSTRGAAPPVGLGEALARGLAPDGGLYVPEALPPADPVDPAEAPSLAAFTARALRPFFADDALAFELDAACAEALPFDAPLARVVRAADRLSVLELFHGPTCAFKDVGARFLAACLARLPRARPLTVLVATSGDTGGAVAAAFYGRPGVRVVVLYPKGLVSARQRQQLACWGGNVTTLAVRGTFDDCQALVKAAFADPDLRAAHELTSANSINVGRLLPQAAYYARAASTLFAREGERPSFVVPSGNLGNALACLWARALGFPVGDVALATNANAVVPDFLRTGRYEPRPSVPTLASAMDVGAPSNLERWRHLDAADPAAARVTAESVDDDAIRRRIARDARDLGTVWCPHAAAAAEVYARLPAERRRAAHWVVVATAHPAKFEAVVEPLVGRPIDVPPSLARLLDRTPVERDVDPSLDELRRALVALKRPRRRRRPRRGPATAPRAARPSPRPASAAPRRAPRPARPPRAPPRRAGRAPPNSAPRRRPPRRARPARRRPLESMPQRPRRRNRPASGPPARARRTRARALRSSRGRRRPRAAARPGCGTTRRESRPPAPRRRARPRPPEARAPAPPAPPERRRPDRTSRPARATPGAPPPPPPRSTRPCSRSNDTEAPC
jgi:threonine synthase